MCQSHRAPYILQQSCLFIHSFIHSPVHATSIVKHKTKKWVNFGSPSWSGTRKLRTKILRRFCTWTWNSQSCPGLDSQVSTPAVPSSHRISLTRGRFIHVQEPAIRVKAQLGEQLSSSGHSPGAMIAPWRATNSLTRLWLQPPMRKITLDTYTRGPLRSSGTMYNVNKWPVNWDNFCAYLEFSCNFIFPQTFILDIFTKIVSLALLMWLTKVFRSEELCHSNGFSVINICSDFSF